jgi:hypothetical protein
VRDLRGDDHVSAADVPTSSQAVAWREKLYFGRISMDYRAEWPASVVEADGGNVAGDGKQLG